MHFPELNYLAVLVSAVAYFMLGAVWYTALGKTWMRLVGKTEEELRQRSPAVPYTVTFLTILITALVMAYVLKFMTDGTFWHGLQVALLMWLGFGVGTAAKHYAFAGKAPLLFLMDACYDLLGYMMTAIILNVWK
ncbi:MAG: DUF1761 domain-containing protein [Tepidisphaeraceae bacterium]